MANLIILAVHLPSFTGTLLGGFVLTSDDGDYCEVAFRCDWQGIVGQEDAEVLNGMEDTLQRMLRGTSCSSFVAGLEERLSNVVRCGERLKIVTDQPLVEHARLLRRQLLGSDR